MPFDNPVLLFQVLACRTSQTLSVSRFRDADKSAPRTTIAVQSLLGCSTLVDIKHVGSGRQFGAWTEQGVESSLEDSAVGSVMM
jgi:hypothetical protein